MPRLSTLSNPTGLIELDKQRINIFVDDEATRLGFSLVRIDITDLHLPMPLDVVVVARRGNSEERVELGSIATWDKSFRPLAEISEDGSLSFRVLLVQPGNTKLIAAAENVRADGLGDSSSFIALEPADLGQCPWEIQILELEGRAVIKFNREIYHSSGEAAADKFFVGMILPEAIRRLAEWISNTPGVLDDSVWEPFKAWLMLHGIEEEPEADTDTARRDWCDEIIEVFCNRFEFVTELKNLRAKGSEE